MIKGLHIVNAGVWSAGYELERNGKRYVPLGYGEMQWCVSIGTGMRMGLREGALGSNDGKSECCGHFLSVGLLVRSPNGFSGGPQAVSEVLLLGVM